MNWLRRLHNFLHKPQSEKAVTIRLRFKRLWRQLFPSIPLLIRLPYGGWWLTVNDVCSDAIFTGNFEEAEWRFVEHFLREGMTVLDIGAHHGFYTILAAKKVGPSGSVIAFEPSPRERKKLLLHLKLNRCTNVKVEPFALASQDGEATLFVVNGRNTGYNSLRPPVVSEPIKAISVRTMRLDTYLEKEHIHNVDFIKIDVEGAELETLNGAKKLLGHNSRCVIMIEVSDVRTAPWGYPAYAIYDFLSERSYQWFAVTNGGALVPCTKSYLNRYENLVAVSQGMLDELGRLVGPHHLR